MITSSAPLPLLSAVPPADFTFTSDFRSREVLEPSSLFELPSFDVLALAPKIAARSPPAPRSQDVP